MNCSERNFYEYQEPERKIFKIDVKNISKSDAMEYINKLKEKFKKNYKIKEDNHGR